MKMCVDAVDTFLAFTKFNEFSLTNLILLWYPNYLQDWASAWELENKSDCKQVKWMIPCPDEPLQNWKTEIQFFNF